MRPGASTARSWAALRQSARPRGTHGWKFEGKRELYDHGNAGLPDQFWPVKHHGEWQHHEMAVWTGGGKHDFTPERKPEVVVQEIGVWEQLVGLVRREPQIRDFEIAC